MHRGQERDQRYEIAWWIERVAPTIHHRHPGFGHHPTNDALWQTTMVESHGLTLGPMGVGRASQVFGRPHYYGRRGRSH
jgi:hypothetical protein